MSSSTPNSPAQASSSLEAPLPRQRAPRLPASERRALILKEAARFFAERGFSASTRDLADALGVRQALLYKYFPSKEALIEAIFAEVFGPDPMDYAAVMRDTALPLGDRIGRIYWHHLAHEDGNTLRLILRAALENWSWPADMLVKFTRDVFAPAFAELRQELGLPDLAARPLTVGEYELATGLHASIGFIAYRRHIYRHALGADEKALIDLQVATFIASIRANLRRLHEAPADPAFAAPLDLAAIQSSRGKTPTDAG